MSVDIWMYCSDKELSSNVYDPIPSIAIDWGDARDTKFKLYKLNGKLLTTLLATRLLKLPNSSLLSKDVRKHYLFSNIGKKVYFIYT